MNCRCCWLAILRCSLELLAQGFRERAQTASELLHVTVVSQLWPEGRHRLQPLAPLGLHLVKVAAPLVKRPVATCRSLLS